jgi:allantoinase
MGRRPGLDDDGRPWPGGRKVAVWVTLNVECFVAGQPGPSLQPHLAHGHDIANYGWREYGNRSGFWRLLDLLSSLSIPVTAAVNGELTERHPEIAAAVRDAGWAVMAHGLENTTRHHGLTPDAERDRIKRTVALLEHAVGRRPLGWLTPGFAVSDVTERLLCEAGLRYTADHCDSDTPYYRQTEPGSLLAIPYSLETNDISLLLCMHYTAEQFADAVVAHVAQLCAEPAAGTVAGIGLHTFLAGQPGRVASLRSCLARIAAMPEVWLCTGDEIYTHLSGLAEREPPQ